MESGVYQVQFRGLTVAECWRFGGPAGFPIALAFKLFNKQGGYQWLPTHESEIVCDENELSPEARAALSLFRGDLQRLGYGNKTCFLKNRYMLDETITDGGALLALHDEGKKSLFLGFVRARFGNSLRDTTTVCGTLFFADDTSVAVCTTKNFFDGSRTAVTHLPGGTPDSVDDLLSRRLSPEGHRTLHFSDLDALLARNARQERLNWDERIARGLLRKVAPDEQTRVLFKMASRL